MAAFAQLSFQLTVIPQLTVISTFCCGSGCILPRWVISEWDVVPGDRLCYLPSVPL